MIQTQYSIYVPVKNKTCFCAKGGDNKENSTGFWVTSLK